MQASQPTNETRLPRAVLRKSASIEARLAARNDPEKVPAEPPTTPATPPAVAAAEDTPDPKPKAPVVPEADPRENDPLYWKHRFQAVAGRLRAREDEHKDVVDGLRREITELQEQVRKLQTTSKPNPTEIDLSEFFSPEQIKELGEEDARTIAQAALKASAKHAQEIIEKEVKPLRDQRQADVDAQEAQRKREFEEALEALLPNYRELDQDVDWQAWLAEEDEQTGMQRQRILTNHVLQRNAPAVAKMFKAFFKPPVAQPPVAPTGSGAAPSGDPPAAPAVAGTGYPSAAEIKDFFTRSAIKKPGQHGFVTDKERAAFEARLKQPRR